MPEVPEKVKKLIKKATYRSMWWHEFLSKYFMTFFIIVNILFGLLVLTGALRYCLIEWGYVDLQNATIPVEADQPEGTTFLEFYRRYDIIFSVLALASGIFGIFVQKEMLNRTKKSIGMQMVIIEVSCLFWFFYLRIVQDFTLGTINTAFWGIMTLLFSLVMFIINYIYYNRRNSYFQN